MCPSGSLKASLDKPSGLRSSALSGTWICVCEKSLCAGVCHFHCHPEMPEPLGSWLAGRWCQKGCWPRWALTPEGTCRGALAGGRSPSQLCAAIPEGTSPGRRSSLPSSAPGELLVQRQREEAASSEMALTLSASQSPGAALTSGLTPGPARTLPAAHTAPRSSREQEGHCGWVAAGGRRRQ